MKLTLKKSKMKNLSQSSKLQMNATPAVAGGGIIDNTPTRYLEGCDRHSFDWQYSCGLGDGCNDVPR
ncbi:MULTISPECIES: hypothetical protein [unclassified Pseudoalteromonas]|uniref:hypothetical protein n=1 Tax=unclassified Pseudoalteromonas TaxID=194690 RepID=UPI002097205C|nr:hypothetical protein [Pseudoalteromonas sp. XMcav2-N]MCO7189526.1 hypothetical protein [Pseudoalteromonas sp. XMcav2-N]